MFRFCILISFSMKNIFKQIIDIWIFYYLYILAFDHLNLIEYPSYRNVFGRMRRIAVIFLRIIVTLLFIHCLHFGYVLFAESVSLTKFYLLFLRNGINIGSKPSCIAKYSEYRTIITFGVIVGSPFLEKAWEL